MQLNPLTAISPIDGRYFGKVARLSGYFSEEALFRYRLWAEVEYLIALSELNLPELPAFTEDQMVSLRAVVEHFNLNEAVRIKEIEASTNHDVKAVEYYLKEKVKSIGLGRASEFIHFGLTSQDINNTAVPLSIKEFIVNEYKPAVTGLTGRIEEKVTKWKNVAMLSRTHGQPATPTTVGHQLMVFVERLKNQLALLDQVPFSGKFGGATGGLNAHFAAYPEVNWVKFADKFLEERIGLKRQQFTTQIEHYDMLAALFDNLRRINVILIDFCRDMWSYISMEYFKQKAESNEVGSSTMPHKINPIDFENAEGNLGIANVLFDHFSNKLPISRLQRDLTDSTVTRNIGVPMAHTYLALQSLEKGLSKIILNEVALKADLERHWVVVAEAWQTILRKHGYPQPYEKLKELTRNGVAMTREAMEAFADALDVSDTVKAELKAVTPMNYLGR